MPAASRSAIQGKVRRFCKDRRTTASSESCSTHDRRALLHPGRDKVLAVRRGPGDHGGDTAAAGMAHDHDAPDIEHLDPELQRRRDAVQEAVGFIRGDQIGDVADDEQLARGGVEDQGRVSAAVGTGDHKGVGPLTVGGERLILGLRLGPVAVAKAVITGKQGGTGMLGHGVGIGIPVAAGERVVVCRAR